MLLQYFQDNEWKALKFALKRSPRTNDFFSIIDRYDNSTAAFRGGNDGPFWRESECGPRRMTISNTESEIKGPSVSFVIHGRGYIDEIFVNGLEDDDILDLSYLPRKMTVLFLERGNLTGIDLGKLPQGLESLSLRKNNISTMDVKSTPSSLKYFFLEDNPVKEKGITLHLPLTNHLELFVPMIGSLNLNGGQKHPILDEGTESAWRVHWTDGTEIEVRAAPEEVEFDFYAK